MSHATLTLHLTGAEPEKAAPESEPLPAETPSRTFERARSIRLGGREITLEWHRGRLAADAPCADPEVLTLGLSEGAQVELDLRLLSDGGFAILHDKTLARETTGRGRVAVLDTPALKALRVRAPDGTRLDRAPMDFDDLARLIARSVQGDARVHLDLKAMRDELGPAHIARFRKAANPIQHRLELGGRDWEAVLALGQGLPDMALGFDPTLAILSKPGLDPIAFEAFIGALRDGTKGASAYYLHHATVTAWLGLGVNPVALLGQAGARIYAWTITADMEGLGTVLADLVSAGIDSLITDDAPRLARMCARETHSF